MKRFVVEGLDDLDTVAWAIRNELDITKKPVEVRIGPPKIDRSAEQNSLMWLWLTEIGNATGHSKDEMHRFYKEKFLISIFVRDDPDYAEMAAAIKAVKAVGARQHKALRDQVIELTSTTKCSVGQMKEYLNEIKRHAVIDLRINLTEPSLRGLI